jgi:hypothetical protein
VNTKNIYPIGYLSINAPSSYCYLSQSFVAKRHRAMQKLFMKRKKSIGKNEQVSEISKTMGTPMPASKKKKRDK